MTLLSRPIDINLTIDSIGFEYSTTAEVVVLHQRAHRGATDGGLKIEPDEPESYELMSIFLAEGPMKVDLLPLLNDREMEKLLSIVTKRIKDDNEAALIEHHMQRHIKED